MNRRAFLRATGLSLGAVALPVAAMPEDKGNTTCATYPSTAIVSTSTHDLFAEAMKALEGLKPWAERTYKLCMNGSEWRHCCVDGCGPIIHTERCKHGSMRYGAAAFQVLYVLERVEALRHDS